MTLKVSTVIKAKRRDMYLCSLFTGPPNLASVLFGTVSHQRTFENSCIFFSVRFKCSKDYLNILNTTILALVLFGMVSYLNLRSFNAVRNCFIRTNLWLAFFSLLEIKLKRWCKYAKNTNPSKVLTMCFLMDPKFGFLSNSWVTYKVEILL